MQNGFRPKCAWPIACRDVVDAEEMSCVSKMVQASTKMASMGKQNNTVRRRVWFSLKSWWDMCHKILETEISIEDVLIVSYSVIVVIVIYFLSLHVTRESNVYRLQELLFWTQRCIMVAICKQCALIPVHVLVFQCPATLMIFGN